MGFRVASLQVRVQRAERQLGRPSMITDIAEVVIDFAAILAGVGGIALLVYVLFLLWRDWREEREFLDEYRRERAAQVLQYAPGPEPARVRTTHKRRPQAKSSPSLQHHA
jgi:hypothetical protein